MHLPLLLKMDHLPLLQEVLLHQVVLNKQVLPLLQEVLLLQDPSLVLMKLNQLKMIADRVLV
jgi:hypothetical protein